MADSPSGMASAVLPRKNLLWLVRLSLSDCLVCGSSLGLGNLAANSPALICTCGTMRDHSHRIAEFSFPGKTHHQFKGSLVPSQAIQRTEEGCFAGSRII